MSPASPADHDDAEPDRRHAGTTTVTLLDSAVLSGGYSPIGTITFTLVVLGRRDRGHRDGDGQRQRHVHTPTGYTLPMTGDGDRHLPVGRQLTRDNNNNSDASETVPPTSRSR